MLLLCRSLTRRHQSIESLFDLAPDARAIPRKVVSVVVAQCKEPFNAGTAVVWALHAQHRRREVLDSVQGQMARLYGRLFDGSSLEEGKEAHASTGVGLALHGSQGWLDGSSMADCKDVLSRGIAAILALHLERTVCGRCQFVLTAACKPLSAN